MTTPLRERLRLAASTGLANAMNDALLALPQPERDEKFIQIMEGDRNVDIDTLTGLVTMTLDGEVFLQTTVEALIGVPRPGCRHDDRLGTTTNAYRYRLA